MPTQFDYQTFIKNLPAQPGVYQMLDASNKILYVGKAKNLKKRVASYFLRGSNDARINSLISQIAQIEVIITKTENEALLLENNLIKKIRPRYNVLFRDDKSYPYIYLSDHPDYPRLDFYRGPKTQKGRYFGPYPSASAVRESLTLIQKLFKLRQCTDTFFRSRTRPCIQYQIDRCTAPCVGYIDPEHYQQNVRLAELFLEGKNQQLIEYLIEKMEAASAALEFEEAKRYRDQITVLRKIQERQYITTKDEGDIDVVAVVVASGEACVDVLFFRAGRLIGNHAYFPKTPPEVSPENILTEFLPQYYLTPTHRGDIPRLILTNILPTDSSWIESVLSEQAGHKVSIQCPQRGQRLQWLRMSIINAENALRNHLAGKANFYKRFEALQQALKLDNLPQRLECFDISHTFGEAIVASCVVFTVEGSLKEAYRRFNIEGITKGDDYAALRQAITRRYLRVKEKEETMPDIIIIDGGKGQLHQAERVLEELQISGVVVIGIAKGAGRKSGLETIYVDDEPQPLELAPDALAFHLLQQIRDEAHRFAITGHKRQREKKRVTSVLQEIAGIGPKRRKQLLQYFGGMQGVQSATKEELAKVPGISPSLAERIYDAIHR